MSMTGGDEERSDDVARPDVVARGEVGISSPD
jgi:hypothetical protein